MVRQFVSCTGLVIKVGENAAENQRLCKQASQKDFWFHLDNSPSPHAILEVADGEASKVSIRECAMLVKHFSKKKNIPQAVVIYIQAKYVSKSGVESKTGAVSLKKSPEKITVYTDEESLQRILQTQT